MRGASLVKVFNLLMLCEVIAYILSRQRLSAKTFVTGCVFYALQDRLSLWMLCDTSGVGKVVGITIPRVRPLGITRGYA